ncbi:MAG: XrtA-associated tyrosine autokinase [Burkholderiaceae bacterium]|nr:XrtA-associated tyrosine autokinase [Burkholderiaceae bacterium]
MSTLIEQAMLRLERLRGAGFAGTPTGQDAKSQPRSPDPRGSGLSGRGTTVTKAIRTSRLIELNAAAMTAAGVFAPGAGPAAQAKQFRMMKRPLIKNIEDLKETGQLRSNLIMVTSALAGEGKSFTAANMAMSMATELDHRVLLVDADVARPSLARMLGFEADQGLLDVLQDRVALQDVLLATNVEKLSVLPSGMPRPGATELLASDSMRRLLEDLASRYSDRIIIFDSPPLLLTTEAGVLASQMGQIVVVVKADDTSQADVQRALAGIASHPVKLMVLNRVHAKMMRGTGYGYAYGYGYGSVEDA